MTGKVGGARLLAERLADDVTVVKCFLFANIGKEEDCSMVADKEEHDLKIRKSHVDLGTGVILEYLT